MRVIVLILCLMMSSCSSFFNALDTTVNILDVFADDSERNNLLNEINKADIEFKNAIENNEYDKANYWYEYKKSIEKMLEE